MKVIGLWGKKINLNEHPLFAPFFTSETNKRGWLKLWHRLVGGRCWLSYISDTAQVPTDVIYDDLAIELEGTDEMLCVLVNVSYMFGLHHSEQDPDNGFPSSGTLLSGTWNFQRPWSLVPLLNEYSIQLPDAWVRPSVLAVVCGAYSSVGWDALNTLTTTEPLLCVKRIDSERVRISALTANANPLLVAAILAVHMGTDTMSWAHPIWSSDLNAAHEKWLRWLNLQIVDALLVHQADETAKSICQPTLQALDRARTSVGRCRQKGSHYPTVAAAKDELDGLYRVFEAQDATPLPERLRQYAAQGSSDSENDAETPADDDGVSTEEDSSAEAG